MSSSNILVAYFSRAGDNWSVGKIAKGNTKCIAEIIAAKTGGKLFEIEPVKAYPDDYDECTRVAKKEKNQDARPAITSTVPNMQDFDKIFIGYPCWWSDAPMPVYTFLEAYDLSGKTIIPFTTHEGSGMSGVRHISKVCPHSTIKEGLAIQGETAQNNKVASEKAVDAWLTRLE